MSGVLDEILTQKRAEVWRLKAAPSYVRVPSGPPHPALLVAGEAIAFDQQGQYVLVVDDTDVVARRPITTGMQVGSDYVVTTGLQASDRIVVQGILHAVPGRKVTIAASTTPAAAPASH